MRLLTRRGFVAAAGAAACAMRLRGQDASMPETTVHLGSAAGSRVPADFLGLSFPAATLNDPTFFAPENISLVQQIRSMAPRGVLRLAGGSTAMDGVDTKVIDNLDGFLKAIGWTCVYGLRTDGQPQAACEYIADRLGPRLNSFELSSGSDSSPQRALQSAKALQAAVTGIRFNVTADDFGPWLSSAERPEVHAVSDTYTRGAGGILATDAGVERSAEEMSKVAAALGAQDMGVAEASVMQPDTFAAALWSAHAALRWMMLGYTFACFRDGVMRSDGRNALSPVGHGLKFAAAFAGAVMLPVTVDAVAANVMAYAGRRADGKILVAIFNMEAATSVRLTAPFFDTLQVLTAPSLEAREAHVSHIVSETGSRRTTAGQSFTLPPHMATLLVLR